MEEFVALTDSKLSVFTGNEEEINSYDERPQNKITNFRYYRKSPSLDVFSS